MTENQTIQIQSTMITANDALAVITENFNLFVDAVSKTMPKREHLSLMGKDDAYMRALAIVYAKSKGINAITVNGQDVRDVMDYMDIIYTAHLLKQRNALDTFELDRSEEGKFKLIIK